MGCIKSQEEATAARAGPDYGATGLRSGSAVGGAPRSGDSVDEKREKMLAAAEKRLKSKQPKKEKTFSAMPPPAAAAAGERDSDAVAQPSLARDTSGAKNRQTEWDRRNAEALGSATFVVRK